MPGEHQEEVAPRACCGIGDLPGLVLRFPSTIHSAQAISGPTPHPQTPRCPCPTQQRARGDDCSTVGLARVPPEAGEQLWVVGPLILLLQQELGAGGGGRVYSGPDRRGAPPGPGPTPFPSGWVDANME